MDIRLELPQLHPKQQWCYDHPARIKVICAGRRGGKSKLSRTAAILAALQHNYPVMWAVPKNKNALQTWDDLKQTTRPLWKVRGFRILAEAQIIEFPGGGSIQVASLHEPDNILGAGYGMIVVDEAARVPEGIWEQHLLPMMADYRDSRAYIISTPTGLNWFYDEYQRGVEGEDDYAAFHFTSYDNPHLDRGWIEKMRDRLPERIYRQEILAEFMSDAIGVFRYVRECTDTAPNPEPQPNTSYVFGVDWGRSEDYTAISVWDTYGKREVFLDRFTGVAYTFQRDRLKALYEKYRPSLIVAEENAAGSTNIEELQKEGLPIVGLRMTNPEKIRLVRKMQLALEKQELILYPSDVANGELLAFDEQKTKTGFYTYGAPKGKHDDTVVSRMLAVDQLGEQIGEVETWVW